MRIQMLFFKKRFLRNKKFLPCCFWAVTQKLKRIFGRKKIKNSYNLFFTVQRLKTFSKVATKIFRQTWSKNFVVFPLISIILSLNAITKGSKISDAFTLALLSSGTFTLASKCSGTSLLASKSQNFSNRKPITASN